MLTDSGGVQEEDDGPAGALPDVAREHGTARHRRGGHQPPRGLPPRAHRHRLSRDGGGAADVGADAAGGGTAGARAASSRCWPPSYPGAAGRWCRVRHRDVRRPRRRRWRRGVPPVTPGGAAAVPAGALAAAVAAAFGVCALLVPLAIRAGVRWRLLDEPDDRRHHQGVVPRTGGIAVAGGLAAGAGVAFALGALPAVPGAGGPGAALLFVGATAIVFAVGLLDDARGCSVGLKLGVETIAALLIVGAGHAVESVSTPVGPVDPGEGGRLHRDRGLAGRHHQRRQSHGRSRRARRRGHFHHRRQSRRLRLAPGRPGDDRRRADPVRGLPRVPPVELAAGPDLPRRRGRADHRFRARVAGPDRLAQGGHRRDRHGPHPRAGRARHRHPARHGRPFPGVAGARVPVSGARDGAGGPPAPAAPHPRRRRPAHGGAGRVRPRLRLLPDVAARGRPQQLPPRRGHAAGADRGRGAGPQRARKPDRRGRRRQRDGPTPSCRSGDEPARRPRRPAGVDPRGRESVRGPGRGAVDGRPAGGGPDPDGRDGRGLPLAGPPCGRGGCT